LTLTSSRASPSFQTARERWDAGREAKRKFRLTRAGEEEEEEEEEPSEETEVKRLLTHWEHVNKGSSLVSAPSWSAETEGKMKSRADLLRQVETACQASETPILKEDFKDMDFKTLRSLRKIGKQCFTLEELFTYLRQTVEQNLPTRNPLTRERWTTEFLQEVLRQYQTTHPEATLTPPAIALDEKQVQLKIVPVEVKLRHQPQQPRYHFWHIQVVIPSMHRTLDLGFVPEYEDSKDVSNNTGVLLSALRQLWEKRRLLSIHSPLDKITCCRVHLRKPVEYWLLPNGQINGELVRKMTEELKDLL
jgi:hypothetical protein